MSLGHQSVSEASRKGYRLRVGDEQGKRSHFRNNKKLPCLLTEDTAVAKMGLQSAEPVTLSLLLAFALQQRTGSESPKCQ
jgi:hypothetical protein